MLSIRFLKAILPALLVGGAVLTGMDMLDSAPVAAAEDSGVILDLLGQPVGYCPAGARVLVGGVVACAASGADAGTPAL
ncbi:MAG TPA: hypothetical protein VNI01_11575 [Elusimicrobiota bacterium]|jgi:hypothetical protein|nr:hypothetical protein [Elusimicrobiota bacterium]